ncbi:MAG: ankyrin repeat domain-containing protein [Clostridiales bacterium]|nr:ankyrin repeat domain-containing protein [Clostridiales bacterium]
MKKKVLKSFFCCVCLVLIFAKMGYCYSMNGDDSKQDSFNKTKVALEDEALLNRACEMGDLDEVKKMINKGLDINTRDKDGNAPIHYACKFGHLDVVKYLLDKGSDIESKGQGDYTPLYVASYNNKVEVAKYLLENGANVNACDMYHNSILSNTTSNAEIVELLLEYGADIESYDSIGFKPLHNACLLGSVDSVKLLLEHGANVEDKTLNNQESIHLIQNKEKAYLLLKYGADINVKSTWGETVLLSACAYSKSCDYVKFLLDNGADINSVDCCGYTPLISAIISYSPDEGIIKLLLDHGADANIKDIYGKYALDYALELGDEDIIKLVMEKSSKAVVDNVLPDE